MAAPTSIIELLSRQATTATSSTIRDLLDMGRRPEVLSLAGGLPATELLPGADIVDAVAAVVARRGGAALQYGPTAGEPELRSLLAADPDDVVVTGGSQQGLYLLGRVLVDPGDPVVVEDPCYLGARQALATAGAQLTGVPVDHHGLDTSILEQHLTRGLRPKIVYVNPSFQNPTGAVLSSERRRHLGELADRYGFVIVADDAYHDLRYDGSESIPLGGPRIVVLRTASKTIAPGLRIGWMTGPRPILDAVVIAKQAVDLQSNGLAQLALAELLGRSGWREQRLAASRRCYRIRRDALVASLCARLGDRARFATPVGGLFVWAALPGVDTTALLAPALAAGVAFVPGSAFAVAATAPHHLRLSFATIEPDRLDEAVQRLVAALGATGRGR